MSNLFKICWSGALFTSLAVMGPGNLQGAARLSDYVNTLRGCNNNTSNGGNYSVGNTVPLTTVPNGFTYWVPVTQAQKNGWFYLFSDTAIQGFGASHTPSPWIGDYGEFCVMPEIGTLQSSNTLRAVGFSHTNEVGKSAYYGVTLNNGIKAEMTPTMHCSVMRFTFPGTNSAHILFNARAVATGSVSVNQAAGVITGNVFDIDTAYFQSIPTVYFYATVSKPIAAAGYPANAGVCANVDFATTNNEVVILNIGTSYISVAQAQSNLVTEVGSSSFDTIKEAAATAWDNLLGKIEIGGASTDQLTTFYSSLARAYSYPTAMWEMTNGIAAFFSPADGKVHAGKYYTNEGFWDTYKAAFPLYSILTPSLEGDVLNGFVSFFRQFSWMPQWLAPGDDGSMGGTESDDVFADAYVKGIRNFDYTNAYQSMLENSCVDNGGWAATGRTGNAYEPFTGYVPQDLYGSSAGIGLEDYQADAALARMAAAMGNSADYQYFANKALQYTNQFSASVGGFFRGKNLNGSWRTTDAAFQTNMWGYEFTEGSAWQFRVATAFDGQGLANLFGSRTNLSLAVDQVFNASSAFQVGSYGVTIHEMAEMVAENTGQYCEGNEPGWYMIHMYNYAGTPAKAALRLRDILSRLYSSGFNPVTGASTGNGYPGDEDEGAAASRYVLLASGFFPAAGATAQYLIGSPLYTNIVFHLENGNAFTISAPNNSANNIYVQSATLNGVSYTKNYFTHGDMLNGGTLVLNMGPTPSAWGTGTNDVPTSLTTGSALPAPLQDCTKTGIVTGTAGVGTNLVANAVDNCSQTKWQIAATACSFQCQLPAPTVVSMYTIASSDTASRDPKAWTLQGSNDGSTWTNLDSRSSQTFTWRTQVRNFSCSNTNAYLYYRLQITQNNGDSSTQIAEIELFNNGSGLVITPLPTQSFLSAGIGGVSPNYAANVTNQVSPAPPNGESVAFWDGGTLLGTGILTNGLAIYSSSALAVGPHAVTAIYGGDTAFLASTSSVITFPLPPVVSAPVALPAANVYAGTTVTLVCSNYFGTVPYSFQWQTSATGTSYTNVDGATTNLLTLANTAATNSGFYQLVFTANGQSVTSLVLSLTVFTALPTIGAATVSPSSTVNQGATVTLNCLTNNGAPPFSLQWQMSPNGVNYTNVPGGTGFPLALAGVSTNQSGYYQCIYTAAGLSVTSAPAQLTVQPLYISPAAILPSNVLFVGQTAILTCSNYAEVGSYGFQWQAGANGTTWTNVPGASTNQLVLLGVTTNNAGYYQCVLTAANGSATSAPVQLTMQVAGGPAARLPIKFAPDQSSNHSFINLNWTTPATKQPAGVLNTTNWNNWNATGSSPYSWNAMFYDVNGKTNANKSTATIIDYHAQGELAVYGSTSGWANSWFTNNNASLLNSTFWYGVDQLACQVTNLDPVFANNGYSIYIYYLGQNIGWGQQYCLANYAGQTTSSAVVSNQVCSLYTTTNWNSFNSGAYLTNLPSYLKGTAIFTQGVQTTSTTHGAYPTWENAGADYIVFSNCPPGGAFSISVSNTYYAGICGIEIVQNVAGAGGLLSTVATLAASTNSVPPGGLVSFTNTVSPAPPNGEYVVFMDGTTVLGLGTLGGGKAIGSSASLAGGSHNITAVYVGDKNYLASTSSVATVTVVANPTLSAPVALPSADVYTGMNVVLVCSNYTGTPPFSFQWQAGGDGVLYTNVTDALTNQMTLTGVTTNNSGYYRLAFTASSLSVTSAVMQLTVNPPATMNVLQTDGNLVLTWPQGVLLQATNVTGPWATNNATSPFTNYPTGPEMYYKVRIQ